MAASLWGFRCFKVAGRAQPYEKANLSILPESTSCYPYLIIINFVDICPTSLYPVTDNNYHHCIIIISISDGRVAMALQRRVQYTDDIVPIGDEREME